MSWMKRYLEIVADETGRDLEEVTDSAMAAELDLPDDVRARCVAKVQSEREHAESKADDDS
jgi:hypothetical protein